MRVCRRARVPVCMGARVYVQACKCAFVLVVVVNVFDVVTVADVVVAVVGVVVVVAVVIVAVGGVVVVVVVAVVSVISVVVATVVVGVVVVVDVVVCINTGIILRSWYRLPQTLYLFLDVDTCCTKHCICSSNLIFLASVIAYNLA